MKDNDKKHKNFINKVSEYSNEYHFLNKYENKLTVLEIQHITCKHIWSIVAQNFLRGLKNNDHITMCPECRKKEDLMKSKKEFDTKFKEIAGLEYELLSEFEGYSKKIKLLHKECGNIFNVRAESFMGKSQTRCTKCSAKKRMEKKRKTSQDFEEEFYKKHSYEYKLLTQYSTKRNKVQIKHLPCNHVWESYPLDTLRVEYLCPYCRINKNLKSKEEYIEEVYSLTQGEYDVLGDYLGRQEKVLMRHNICSTQWEVSPSNFIYNNSRCPTCSKNKSFPEQALYFYIKKIIKNTINTYKPNWIGKSEIDIFIPNLNIGIEYDGSFFHKGKLKEDTEKSKLINSHKIKLIRIREEGCPSIVPLNDTLTIDFNPSNNYANFNKLWNDLVSILSIITDSKDKELINSLIKMDIDINRDRYKILENSITELKEQSLLNTHPEITKEWNYKKNRLLKPENFTYGSQSKVWWVCKNGHEWEAVIRNRTCKNSGCPECYNKSKSEKMVHIFDKRRGCSKEDIIKYVNQLLKEGIPRNKIAKDLNYKRIDTMSSAIKKMGYTFNNVTNQYEEKTEGINQYSTQELLNTINNRLIEGETFKAIHQSYRYSSEESFKQVLNKRGLTFNKTLNRCFYKYTIDELVKKTNELIQKGYRIEDIANMLGYSSQKSIGKALNKNNYYIDKETKIYKKRLC